MRWEKFFLGSMSSIAASMFCAPGRQSSEEHRMFWSICFPHLMLQLKMIQKTTCWMRCRLLARKRKVLNHTWKGGWPLTLFTRGLRFLEYFSRHFWDSQQLHLLKDVIHKSKELVLSNSSSLLHKPYQSSPRMIRKRLLMLIWYVWSRKSPLFSHLRLNILLWKTSQPPWNWYSTRSWSWHVKT